LVKTVERPGPTDDPATLGRIGVYETVGILVHGRTGVAFKGYDGALMEFLHRALTNFV
jgi:hypothetical protein